MSAKFILTVESTDDDSAIIENQLMIIARRYRRSRLTRADFEDWAVAPGYRVEKRRRTLKPFRKRRRGGR